MIIIGNSVVNACTACSIHLGVVPRSQNGLERLYLALHEVRHPLQRLHPLLEGSVLRGEGRGSDAVDSEETLYRFIRTRRRVGIQQLLTSTRPGTAILSVWARNDLFWTRRDMILQL